MHSTYHSYLPHYFFYLFSPPAQNFHHSISFESISHRDRSELHQAHGSHNLVSKLIAEHKKKNGRPTLSFEYFVSKDSLGLYDISCIQHDSPSAMPLPFFLCRVSKISTTVYMLIQLWRQGTILRTVKQAWIAVNQLGPQFSHRHYLECQLKSIITY